MHSPFSGIALRILTRLTLWYGLTLVILLSLFALFIYFQFHASIHRDFDGHLTHETRQLLPYIRLAPDGPFFTARDLLLGTVAYQAPGVHGTYVRLLGPDGGVIYSSPNFRTYDVLPITLPEKPETRTISRKWGGNPALTRYTPLLKNGAAGGWLEVTGFEWTLHQELVRLRSTLIMGILLSLVLAIGGGHLLARRALQPVAALTDAANEIGTGNLGSRLPSQFGVRDELTDLAETFNRMIERIQAAFEREHRFTDHAAHELLTPLTTLRNSIEIALRRDREASSYRETLSSVLADVDEMTDTIRGLLHLARIDRIGDLPRERVDLAEVAREHAERSRNRARRQGVEVNVKMDSAAFVFADSGRMGEIVANLLDNAVKYTPEGGEIVVSVVREAAEAVLRVTDTGIGFAPGEAERLFERFYRSNVPEVLSHSGSGLGLVIVRAIVEAYGGEVTANSEGHDRGSTFEVRLPLAPPV